MVPVLRELAVRTLTHPGVVPLVQRWNRNLGIVFMLHRLACPDRGVRGQDPGILRDALGFLRRHRFPIVPLGELLSWARAPERGPGPMVAFTFDDGYAEQADVAGPILAEFDAPATIFPVTGFVDGELWMWWDRLRFVLESTAVPSMHCPELLPPPADVPLNTPAARHRARRAIARSMKQLSTVAREERLHQLAQALEVEIPEEPPTPYRPMSWDDARRLEARGVRVGPHSVSHPTLSREGDRLARREIAESWDRIRQEVDDPEPIFCYPNGRSGDFGPREARMAEEAGLVGAVTAEPGYLSASSGQRSPGSGRSPVAPFGIPRFAFPDLHSHLVRVMSGLSAEERVELPVRKQPVEPHDEAENAIEPDAHGAHPAHEAAESRDGSGRSGQTARALRRSRVTTRD